MTATLHSGAQILLSVFDREERESSMYIMGWFHDSVCWFVMYVCIAIVSMFLSEFFKKFSTTAIKKKKGGNVHCFCFDQPPWLFFFFFKVQEEDELTNNTACFWEQEEKRRREKDEKEKETLSTYNDTACLLEYPRPSCLWSSGLGLSRCGEKKKGTKNMLHISYAA